MLYEQTTRLARRGYDVHILTRKLPYHKERREVVRGVKEWRYEIDPGKNPILFMQQLCKNAISLYQKLTRKYRFDCLNFQQPFTSYAVLRSPLSRAISKIYTCHSLAFEEFISRNNLKKDITHHFKNAINIQGRKIIEKYVLQKSNRIVTLSQYTKKKLCNTYFINADKIEIIPGGVDLRKFHPATCKQTDRKMLNLSKHRFILFTVRNLVERMGIEQLIKALKQILNVTDEVHLVIGGEGPLKSELMALAQDLGVFDHITFTGFIPERLLPSYYKASDVFILPTKELEGFGMVSLEALASGLPVLGTPVGGTVEILGKFAPDFLFPDNQPGSMAKAILDKYRLIKTKPETWRRLSCQARSYVEKNYSWDQNINALEKILCAKRI